LTLHAFIQFLKYEWKAKGRHGIHSPFAYSFVEDVLQNRKNAPIVNETEFPDLSLHYTELLRRIIDHFDYHEVKWLPAEPGDTLAESDVLVFPAREPLLWMSLAGKYLPVIKDNSAVFIPDIHTTHAHTHEWNRICGLPCVPMSIDVYGVGLLFFNADFKEKQHFVLQYRG
jgi:hypothetical protein